MPTTKRERQREGSRARAAAQAAARRKAERRRRLVRLGIVGALVAVLVGALAFRSASDDGDEAVTTETTAPTDTSAPTESTVPTEAAAPGASITGATPCPPADGTAARTTGFEQPPPTCIDPAKTYRAQVVTDVGSFTIDLDAAAAPQTVNNFVVLARYHYFDGVVFHRVVPDFAVQGGDPEGTGRGGPGYTIPDELPEAGAYRTGSVAMANTGQPNTGGSQFFVVAGPAGEALPPQYSLFGQVTEGLDVVERIEADGAPDPNPPRVVHRMESVTITES